MARPCSVCIHKNRDAIDKAILAGEPFRALERQYGLNRDALRRHKLGHITETLAKAQEAAEVVRADNLLDYMETLRKDAYSIKDKAEKARNFSAAIAAIRELVRMVELMAKLRGELQEGTTVNVLVAPEWVALRSRILHVLEPFPEARGALAKALEHAA